MKHLALAALAAFFMSGCASLQFAGTADYQVRPFRDELGATHCCEMAVHNGKEIANLKAHIQRAADGSYTVDLEEQGVTAFQGQAIAAGAAKEAIDAAAKAAVAAAIAPVLPALLPAAGAALSSPGLGAAAVGAGAVVIKDKVTP